MLTQSQELHCADAETVMSDNDVLAQRARMQRLADLTAEFMAFWNTWKDEAAAESTCLEDNDDAVRALDGIADEFRFWAESVQRKTRLHYAKRYVA